MEKYPEAIHPASIAPEVLDLSGALTFRELLAFVEQ